METVTARGRDDQRDDDVTATRGRRAPTIFVSIAAYRDPQVIPTVEDCIAKSSHPAALRFGICWQRDPSDPVLPFSKDRRIRVAEYDWQESRGIAWARAVCMQLFDGEDYYLQIDSHHRFVEGWDEKLLRHMDLTGSAKPILTAHVRNLDLNHPEVMPTGLPRSVFARWDGHIPHFRTGVTPVAERLARPARARSISGHFCFSIGDFVREVPSDPNIYYYGGSEITVAVRAFTSGYDMFHPPEPILSHAYANSRTDRKTHGADHRNDRRKRSRRSKAQVVDFLTDPHIGEYGCGTARTMADYEAYAGLSFRHCRAQDYTHMNGEPPNPDELPGWAERSREWKVRLSLKRSTLPAAFNEAEAWEVRLDDALGRHLHKDVLEGSDVARVLRGRGPSPNVDLTFHSEREPALWSIVAAQNGTRLETISGFVGRGSDHGRGSIRTRPAPVS